MITLLRFPHLRWTCKFKRAAALKHKPAIIVPEQSSFEEESEVLKLCVSTRLTFQGSEFEAMMQTRKKALCQNVSVPVLKFASI